MAAVRHLAKKIPRDDPSADRSFLVDEVSHDSRVPEIQSYSTTSPTVQR